MCSTHRLVLLGLPGQVGVEGTVGSVAVAARLPVAQQERPLHGVRREQLGEPPGHRIATATPELALLAGLAVAEVLAQHPAPRPRPRGHRRPRGAARPAHRATRGRRSRAPRASRDQAGRRPEPHAGADTVLASLRRGRAGGRAAGSASARRPGRGPAPAPARRGREADHAAARPAPGTSRSARGHGGRSSSTHVPPGLGPPNPVNLTQRDRQPGGVIPPGAATRSGGAGTASPSRRP